MNVRLDVEHPASVGYGHSHRAGGAALLHKFFNVRIGALCYLFFLSGEGSHGFLGKAVGDLLRIKSGILGLGKRHFKRQGAEHLFLEIVEGFIAAIGDVSCQLVNHVCDVHADSHSPKGVLAFAVHSITLCVHHIVVFHQTFTDAVIVLLHSLLGVLD